MKRFIALPLILAIAACGDPTCGCVDSSDDNDIVVPTLDITIPATGAQTASITDGGDLTLTPPVLLNHSYDGTIASTASDADGVTQTFTFTSNASRDVLVKIEGTTGNLDLIITGSNGLMIEAEGDTSNKVIVFHTEQDIYTIEVNSNDEIAATHEFTLTVVEANAASAGLKTGEILVVKRTTETEVCNGGTPSAPEEDTYNLIINYSMGYILDLSVNKKHNFATANGKSFTIINNYYGGDYYERTMTITIDTDTLDITGTQKTVDFDENGTCTETEEITGKVLLSK
jgi:hypothetical protein